MSRDGAYFYAITVAAALWGVIWGITGLQFGWGVLGCLVIATVLLPVAEWVKRS